MEYCEINLALARKIPNVRRCNRGRVVNPDGHCRSDCQHPFGSQATASRKPNSLKLGNDRGPWLCAPALRLVCLFEDDDAAGPLTRNYASAHVGQASHLTFDEWCQAKSLTYGSEDEFRAARDLSITCQGADDSSSCLHTNLCQLASKSNEGLETKRKYSVHAEHRGVPSEESLQSD